MSMITFSDDLLRSLPDSTDNLSGLLPFSIIENTAQAEGENTNTANGQNCIKFRGTRRANLSVTKTANVSSVFVGDTFTYTIRITNLGPNTAIGVIMTDAAPNHIIFTPGGVTTTQGSVDPSSTPSNIIVNVGNIAPGATVTITIPATVI
ncbi:MULTISPECIES: DUF11 domain-containing protein [unclassified Clostridium]|uniref:DUF11 domain-containing protein n=1 Tax=unclassified Clostridium TaxID=2614128 RepID=UPI0002972AAF|nr:MULTISPECIES: DUF11 domain-containing protein [unclassified Clostridium]EKQ51328.1 MAG: hypothetical protein A370_04938 [Clostridium sp. Maddingley MBC34-26]